MQHHHIIGAIITAIIMGILSSPQAQKAIQKYSKVIGTEVVHIVNERLASRGGFYK